MILPYETGNVKLTSAFGYRIDPFTQKSSFHGGIDFVGQTSKIVIAVANGIISASTIAPSGTKTAEWGNYVCLQADDGAHIYYCHLDKRYVLTSVRVRTGDHIGIEGSTGKVTGQHLHFEIRKNGVQVDPAAYIGIANQTGFYSQPDYGSEVCRICNIGDDFKAYINQYQYASSAWRKIWNNLLKK